MCYCRLSTAGNSSINDISLAKVTDDFIAYIESLGNFCMGDTADFIVVASTLLLIKSRSTSS